MRNFFPSSPSRPLLVIETDPLITGPAPFFAVETCLVTCFDSSCVNTGNFAFFCKPPSYLSFPFFFDDNSGQKKGTAWFDLESRVNNKARDEHVDDFLQEILPTICAPKLSCLCIFNRRWKGREGRGKRRGRYTDGGNGSSKPRCAVIIWEICGVVYIEMEVSRNFKRLAGYAH